MAKKLYVGNLPYALTEDALREAFSKAGTVESVTIISDRATGQSKGFGFVEMSSNQEATEAIKQFNGQELEGRRLKVNQARPRTPRD